MAAHLESNAKQKAKKILANKQFTGLTYKQQLKQDAMLWAEFLYAEYKREKALLEEAQVMPMYYDKPNA